MFPYLAADVRDLRQLAAPHVLRIQTAKNFTDLLSWKHCQWDLAQLQSNPQPHNDYPIASAAADV